MENRRAVSQIHFGSALLPLPLFHVGATQLAVKKEEKYVGVDLRTDTQNILKDHYKAAHTTRSLLWTSDIGSRRYDGKINA